MMKRIYQIILSLCAFSWFGVRQTAANAAAETGKVAAEPEGAIRVVREDFSAGNLPFQLVGKKIVFLSDLHLRFSNIDSPLMRQLPEVINRCQPDWIIFGGDLADRATLDDAEKFTPLLKLWLQRLKPRYASYAVIGNHDLTDVGRKLYKDAGLPLLDDEFILDHGLLLGGLWDKKWEKNEVPDIFRMLNRSFRVLACHRPEVMTKLPDNYADLVLSGHNHGGVVSLPLIPDGFFVLLFRFRKLKYLHGWYEERGNKQFVTSGVGSVGRFELRFGIRPEILCLTLKKK